MSGTRRPVWTSTVPRVLLVLAVVLGLCAMHVLAAAVSRHHTAVPGASVSTSPAPAVDHAESVTSLQGTDHEHHRSTGDCVLFLSAGVALLVVLLAWATAQALRPSYRLTDPWLDQVIAATPWRGPPPWHWPRVSLCVIRV
ncbi:DUF6153 family protein [Kineococcus rhizosphaerae]|uniref:Uncharacterized protein n=1 Tax=Kineococcus rhizosphaerae TaxID=559628 RepID=A0A2T0R5Y0_9ACTN|nr:DUF6153 family protein [Kineococcus rhizosphaerae]PRY16579.1 hypothetical protein CLV37_1038 [Kineococcus rhizosphaerae]